MPTIVGMTILCDWVQLDGTAVIWHFAFHVFCLDTQITKPLAPDYHKPLLLFLCHALHF